jgi:Ca2+-binding EF-hand superfamily protein
MKFTGQFFFSLALLGAAITFNAQAQHGALRQGTTPEEAAASFAKFYDVVAKANGNKVTIAVMIDAMNAQDSDAKALQRIKAWDKNRDGLIAREEGAQGVKTDLMAYVDEQMKTDSDGDGVLSMAEFTLAVPDPQSPKKENGLTQRQEIMFRGADTNKDEKYSREEAIATNAYRNYHSYIGRRVAYRARVFDLNQDRKYDLTEFALIYGAKPGEPVPQAIQEKFNGKSFGNGNHTYYNVMMRIVHMPLDELAAMDARITEYEKHHATGAAKARAANDPKK